MSNHFSGATESADRLAIAGGITDIVGVILRLWPRETSLTTDFTLSQLQRAGPLRLTRLAESAGVSQPTMTELVARLTVTGEVERRRDPADRRASLVALTDAGVASLARRRSITATRLSELIAALSPEEAASLEAAMPALRRIGAAVSPPAYVTPASPATS